MSCVEDGTPDYQLVVQYDYRRLCRGCTYYLYVFTIIIPQRHTYISICTYIHLVVVAVVGMYVVVVFHQQLLSTIAVVLVFLGLWFYFCYYYFFSFIQICFVGCLSVRPSVHCVYMYVD